jgi:hypothetical protein
MPSPSAEEFLDPHRCPLCGQANQCTPGGPASAAPPCWCFSAPVSRAALERLPAEARGKACLCPRCAALDEPR